MKRILKVLSIFLFFAIFVGVYIYFSFDNQEKKNNEIVIDESEYEERLKEMNEPLTTRLDYDKEILFLYVGELNNGVLRDEVVPNQISQTVANFNEKTQSLYFYNQKSIPIIDTEIMILNGVYSMENLLQETLYTSVDNNLYLDLSEVRYSYANDVIPLYNEDRLFLNTKIKVQKLDDKGTVEVYVGEEKFNLKPMESKEFMKNGENEKSGLKSKIIITNYGLWDTKNMKYEIHETER